ncbi:PKD domain-containing protein [bacterium]|nr:PKD domain-containing protein [bacterium]
MKRHIIRLMLAISGLAIALALAACQSVGPTGKAVSRTEPEKTAEELRESEHGPTQERALVTRFGTEISFRQCKVVFPTGAFSEDIYVAIAFPEDAPEGFVTESAYSITPETVPLDKPALLSLHYFDDDLEASEDESDIKLVRLVEGLWMPVGDFTLDIYNNIVTASIDRLGVFALMVIAPRTPLINDPPVARITYEIILPGEEEETPAEEPAAEEEAPEAPEGVAPADEVIEEPASPAEPEAEGAPQAPADGVPPIANPVPIGANEEGLPGEEYAVEEEAPARTMPDEELDDAEVIEPEDTAHKRRESFLVETPEEPVKPEPTIGATVEFSAAESSDPDGEILRYIWDFNADGVADRVSSTPEATREYDTYGSLLAILQVEDDAEPVGRDVTFAAFEIQRDPLAPKLPFKVNSVAFPAETKSGGKVVLGAAATGGEPPYTFGWTFSDGTTADEPAVILVPGRKGELTGNLTVTDSSGRTVQRTVSANVISAPSDVEGKPEVKVRPNRVYLDVPGKVQFEATVSGAREPVTLLVDPGFGEPLATEDRAFTLSFANAGYYIVTVTATDRAGRGAKTFVPVAVTAGESGDSGAYTSAGRLSFAVKYEKDGWTLRFEAAGAGKKTKLHWEFGDGTASDERSPKKAYAHADEYRVRLTADDGFERRFAERTLPVGGGELAAAIDLPPVVRGMVPFGLTPHAVVTGGKFPLFFRWKLGELFSEEEYPEFVLEKPGTFKLQLTVGDAKGNTYDTYPVAVEVSRTPKKFRYPVAYFAPAEDGEPRVKLSEYDGSSECTFVIGPDNPTDVTLAPQGTAIALLADDGFVAYDLAGGREIMSFTPSRGKVTEVFLTGAQELLAFNIENDRGVRGYLRSEASGILPVSERNERVVDITPDGSAILLASDKGVRMFYIDTFTGGLSGSADLFDKATCGVLTADAVSAFLLGLDGNVYQVTTESGERWQLTHDGNAKESLQVSDDGKTIAYSLQTGDIIVIRPRGDSPGMPVNLTALNGFESRNWLLSPDGRLILAYGSTGSASGLYMLNLEVDLQSASAEDLAPSFYAESTSTFAMSGHRDRFDVLLTQKKPTPEEEETGL